jgi:hypothetical protein
MTMIQQTVIIPPDRRLYLELPKTAPLGQVEIAIMFSSPKAWNMRKPGFSAEFHSSVPTIADCEKEAAEKLARRNV